MADFAYIHSVMSYGKIFRGNQSYREKIFKIQMRVIRITANSLPSRKYSNCQSNSLTDRLFGSVPIPHFTVVGMDRFEEDWYASDNNLRGTPRGSRKKPNAGRQSTGRLSTAVLCRGLEKNGMVRAWHERGMASVNQMGKTHSKPLAAGEWHGHGMLCVNWP